MLDPILYEIFKFLLLPKKICQKFFVIFFICKIHQLCTMHVLIITDAVSYMDCLLGHPSLSLALLIAAGAASESSIEHITHVMNIALTFILSRIVVCYALCTSGENTMLFDCVFMIASPRSKIVTRPTRM